METKTLMTVIRNGEDETLETHIYGMDTIEALHTVEELLFEACKKTTPEQLAEVLAVVTFKVVKRISEFQDVKKDGLN